MQWGFGERGTAVDEELFGFLTELETRKAVRLQYPVSLIAIVPDRQGGDEPAKRRRLAERLAHVLRLLLRGTDVIMVPSASDTVHLLLIDVGLENLPVVVSRFASELLEHTLDENGSSIAFRVGVGSFPRTAVTSKELRTQAVAIAEGAIEDKRGGLRFELRAPGRPGNGKDGGAALGEAL